MMSRAAIATEVDRYIRAIRAWCDIGAQDPERANELADEINRIAEALKQSQQGKEVLTGLLNHEDQYVRVFAAIDALEWVPERARPVLEAAAESRVPGWFEAKWALMQHDGESR